MAIAPQKLREIIFQLLYSFDFGGATHEEMIPLLMRELQVSKQVMRLAIEKQGAVQSKQEEIDKQIVQHSKSYDFERIPRIERNILRLGIFEILYGDPLPVPVAIAEAIRLCRKFATPEAAGFVNAILDAVSKEIPMTSKEQMSFAIPSEV
ncbi:MAG: transcription antitermination factor NusB [Chlamydiales bacterium]|nr:transcription antitermination factor NusB [Chlamydiales bacterium]